LHSHLTYSKYFAVGFNTVKNTQAVGTRDVYFKITSPLGQGVGILADVIKGKKYSKRGTRRMRKI
jgi:hypothetical protein